MHLVCFERLPADVPVDPDDHRIRLDPRDVGFDALEMGRPGARRLGALVPAGPRAGDVVDLNRALAALLALEDAGAPEAAADARLPAEPMAFLRRFQADPADVRAALREAVAFVVGVLEDEEPRDLERAGVLEPRARLRLRAPVPRPGKVIAVARNYGAHAAERGGSAPREPVLFVKASSSVIGPDDVIVLPAASEQVDYEGELAAVVGRRARNVDARDALDFLVGYTVANDVTARDFQHVRGQHFIGKSCDTFCPLGPALVDADAVRDPQDLALATRLSGETVQSARTKEMTFPVAELVAFASRLMTLEPGDVILTGTPGGVGAARRPPRFLRDGDVVEVEIEGIGCLRNPVRAERRTAPAPRPDEETP